jgi:hypothetical protein
MITGMLNNERPSLEANDNKTFNHNYFDSEDMLKLESLIKSQ